MFEHKVNDSGAQELEVDPPVTVEVVRRPLPGKDKEFEDYLNGISHAAMAQRGHLGINIFRPPEGSDQGWRIIFKFDRRSNLQRWEDSPERQRWREVAEEVSTTCRREETTGLESWFTLPTTAAPHPPKHKQTLIVWLGIYFLVNVVSFVTYPLVGDWPQLLKTLVITAIVVPSMTYLVAPFLTRTFKNWLFKH